MVEAAGVEPLGTTFLDEYLPHSSRQTTRVVPADSLQSYAVWQRVWQRDSQIVDGIDHEDIRQLMAAAPIVRSCRKAQTHFRHHSRHERCANRLDHLSAEGRDRIASVKGLL